MIELERIDYQIYALEKIKREMGELFDNAIADLMKQREIALKREVFEERLRREAEKVVVVLLECGCTRQLPEAVLKPLKSTGRPVEKIYCPNCGGNHRYSILRPEQDKERSEE